MKKRNAQLDIVVLNTKFQRFTSNHFLIMSSSVNIYVYRVQISIKIENTQLDLVTDLIIKLHHYTSNLPSALITYIEIFHYMNYRLQF